MALGLTPEDSGSATTLRRGYMWCMTLEAALLAGLRISARPTRPVPI